MHFGIFDLPPRFAGPGTLCPPDSRRDRAAGWRVSTKTLTESPVLSEATDAPDEHGDVTEYVEDLAESERNFLAHPPNVAFFWHPHDRIRVDILLDFPIPASELVRAAEKIETGRSGETILVAGVEHLKELKRIAYNYRRSPKDLRDLEFLERLSPKKEG